MNRLKQMFSAIIMLFALTAAASVTVVSADETNVKKEGYHVVVEGYVSQINAIMLVIDGQQYPLSGYAKVFIGDLNGPVSSVQMIAGVGKIDRARIYLLGGRVEKIVVLKII